MSFQPESQTGTLKSQDDFLSKLNHFVKNNMSDSVTAKDKEIETLKQEIDELQSQNNILLQ